MNFFAYSGIWVNIVLLILLVVTCPVASGDDTSSSNDTIKVSQITAVIGQLYNHTTSVKQLNLYRYVLNNSNDVIRVQLYSHESTEELPILAVVREKNAVMSWSVPLTLENQYTYNTVARTLCPILNRTQTTYTKRGDDVMTTDHENPGFVQIELYSDSVSPVDYLLTATKVRNFELKLNTEKELRIAPSTPNFVKFKMPAGLSAVDVRITSPDTICMIMSIEPIKCPVFDLDTNVKFAGTYQSITTKGAIAIEASRLQEFYIVFVVKPNDRECTGVSRILTAKAAKQFLHREKVINVVVKRSIIQMQYVVATTVMVACFFGISFFIAGLNFIFNVSERTPDGHRIPFGSINNHNRQELSYGALDSDVSSNISIDDSTPVLPGDSAIPNGSGHIDAFQQDSPSSSSSNDASPGSNRAVVTSSQRHDAVRELRSPSEDEYDYLDDAKSDKNVLRSKADLKVSDLSQKSFKKVTKKYNLYHWNLVTISIFYVLPVVQLVLTYQTVVNVTGNQDLCYYNFLCAHPFWNINAFNNVFSNVGYIMLGLLFLALVKSRDMAHKSKLRSLGVLETKNGIPKHFGLLYAMGFALVMEGLLSGCYHICPNYSNFQFDTAFMYMISGLGVLKVYQARHPDINAHAHIAYCVMALLIVISVIGVVYNGLPFWITFSVVYLVLIFLLSAEFYYKGRWKIDRSIFSRVRQVWVTNSGGAWCIPMYPARMIFTVIALSVNIGMITVGLVLRPNDFPSYQLALFIGNLLLYMLFYIAMKMKHRERLGARPVVYMLLAAICWGFALRFFFAEVTTWQKTPAESREENQSCIFLDFYDAHDVWHFLSATSLFLSFMVVLTIDDDLDSTPQTEIAVF